MNIDNKLSQLEIHKVYKQNLKDNIYPNPEMYNVEDDDAEDLNFLSSRFAEYKNLPRNVIGHRP
mgnify:CR=1 FL=1